ELALPAVKRIYAAFGIDLDQPNFTPNIRDFAFSGQTIAVKIPSDVRLVLSKAPGSRFFATLLHELGHAYAATSTRAENPLYAGYEWVPGLSDPALAEGIAEVFARLLDEPRILRDFVGLSDVEAGEFVESRRI